MIGIDIVDVCRFDGAKQSLLDRIFTAYELEYIKNKKMSSATIAGMFAAKEAISKAFKLGISALGLKNMEICHDDNGAPFANLFGEAKKLLCGRNIDISISHTDSMATAICIII